MYGPVLLLGGVWGAGGLVDVADSAGVGDVSAETGFEGVAGAVSEQC